MSVNPNQEHSIDIEKKFSFYFVSLVFTLLALSIQTASFTNPIASIFELFGWLFFLVSGLFSLSRLEWIPCGYSIEAEIQRIEKLLGICEEHMLTGHTEMIDPDSGNSILITKYISDGKNEIDKLVKRQKPMKKSIESKYKYMKWCFVAGLVCLIVARGLTPTIDTYNCLKHDKCSQPTTQPKSK